MYLLFYRGRRLFLVMRFTVFFLLTGLVQVYASAYSQNTKLSLNMKNVQVKEILDQIKRESEFKFLYRSDLFDNLHPVSVQMKDASIENILEPIMTPYGISYEIRDNVVIFKERPVEKELL